MKFKISILTCILASSFLVGCNGAEANEATPAVAIEDEIVLRTVETEKISTMSMSNSMEYSGRVAPSKEVSVASNMSGKILTANFDIGDTVNEGDVLVIVDDSDLVDNMRNMEANYAISELNFRNSEKIYNNNIILFDEGVISQSDIDQIIYSYETAKANLYSLEVQMDILESSMEDTVLTSPTTGVVTIKNVEEGGYANLGSPAYTIVNLNPVRINVGVSEHLINTISVGQTLPVKISAVSNSTLSGEVAVINPLMDQTGMYTIGIDVANPDYKIKSGMLADVTFVLQSSGNAVAVPTNAIISKDTGNYIYLINREEDGKITVKETKVTTGMENGNMTQITSGVSAGREIVIKGQTYISDGEEVKLPAEYIRQEVIEVVEESEELEENSENGETQEEE